MKKTITVDFYHVESATPFENILSSVMRIPSGARRNEPTSGGIIRLRHHGNREGFIFGDIMRIRQDEPTIVASTNGDETAVAEGDDEGLGVTNAFLYSPDRKVLLYQRNRSGVSAARASYYFQQMAHIDHAILFNPVLGEDVHNKLRSLGAANMLRVKMAPGRVAQDLGEDGPLFQVVKAAREMESPVVDIKFSLGKGRRGSLSLGNIFNAIRWTEAKRAEGMTVDALELIAREEGCEKVEVLDLLEAKLKFSISVESTKLIEAFYERRIESLFEAWTQRARQIPQF